MFREDTLEQKWAETENFLSPQRDTKMRYKFLSALRKKFSARDLFPICVCVYPESY